MGGWMERRLWQSAETAVEDRQTDIKGSPKPNRFFYQALSPVSVQWGQCS